MVMVQLAITLFMLCNKYNTDNVKSVEDLSLAYFFLKKIEKLKN